MNNKIEILEKLNEIDIEFEPSITIDLNEEENCKLMTMFSKDNITKNDKMAVLGLDIYKYSEFDEDKQNLIPFVFDIIFDEAWKHITQTIQGLPSDLPLFRDIKDTRENFISTGDGGFLLFNTPLHAVIFNLHFYSILHLFNTGHFYPRLSKYIGDIIVRSAITYDNVFRYEKKYFGKPIIDNARMLSKDKLNRFIIDKSVYQYFNKYFNGIGNLPIINIESIERAMGINIENNLIFFTRRENENRKNYFINDRIRNVHIQKIEELTSKNTRLELYNLEIQIFTIQCDEIDTNKEVSLLITVGNTNLNNIL